MKDSIKNFADLKRIAERNGLLARTWSLSDVPGKPQQVFSIERSDGNGFSTVLHVQKTLRLSATWLFGYEEGLSYATTQILKGELQK